MAIHVLEPGAASRLVPRAWPCEAWMEQGRAPCGALPSLLFRRVCTHHHTRDVHLCEVHERLIGRVAVCRDCATLPGKRAHRCAVALVLVPEALDLIRR